MRIYRDRLQNIHEKPVDAPLHWRLSAYGLLENDKGEWLMVEPAWTTRLDLPGGGVEIDESMRDAVKRELYEETGYKVEAEEMPIYLGENDFYYDYIDQFQHCIILVYRIRLTDEKRDAEVVNTVEGFEIRDMRWVDPKSLTEDQVQPIFWPLVARMRAL
ncbi:MAG: NUDIX hydrolase [Candidatus Uhrbacteria bacterium]|nr:NUDIX hydrolase [Candidatus Uhrbacteria bacterium]